MGFSGGSYDEVARWLRNFLTSHARREQAGAEVMLQAGDEREGRSYAARLRLGSRVSDLLEFDYKEVADSRGSLAWCRTQAERVRALTRGLAAGPPPGQSADR